MALTIHLDTNAYTAFARGATDAIYIIEHSPLLVVSPIVLGELKAGFLLGRESVRNLDRLRSFVASPRAIIPAIDDRITDNYAVIYKQLRLDGRPIPTNDMWIAACAIGDGQVLFTDDVHFDLVDGLRIVRGREDLEKLMH